MIDNGEILLDRLEKDNLVSVNHPVAGTIKKATRRRYNMTKERHQIESECPECGCGLIDDMTPDEFREKQGNTKDKVPVNCSECGKDHDGCVTEEHTPVQNKTES